MGLDNPVEARPSHRLGSDRAAPSGDDQPNSGPNSNTASSAFPAWFEETWARRQAGRNLDAGSSSGAGSMHTHEVAQIYSSYDLHLQERYHQHHNPPSLSSTDTDDPEFYGSPFDSGSSSEDDPSQYFPIPTTLPTPPHKRWQAPKPQLQITTVAGLKSTNPTSNDYYAYAYSTSSSSNPNVGLPYYPLEAKQLSPIIEQDYISPTSASSRSSSPMNGSRFSLELGGANSRKGSTGSSALPSPASSVFRLANVGGTKAPGTHLGLFERSVDGYYYEGYEVEGDGEEEMDDHKHDHEDEGEYGTDEDEEDEVYEMGSIRDSFVTAGTGLGVVQPGVGGIPSLALSTSKTDLSTSDLKAGDANESVEGGQNKPGNLDGAKLDLISETTWTRPRQMNATRPRLVDRRVGWGLPGC